jgi:uncharacterized protein
MAEQQIIQPDRLPAKGVTFEGSIRPGDLEALAEELATPEGELHYRVSAQVDNKQRRIVSCIIKGFVFLTCYSTSEVFRHDVAIDDRLVLVGSKEELPPFEEESDREDYVVATESIDVRDLVEEAVILSLPMVPRKPGLAPVPEPEAVKIEKPSPFAALASLKRPK